jgi:hypothetical protein
MASTINASSTGSGGLISSGDASGVLQLQSNGTTALTATGANLVTTGSISSLNTFGFENRIINGGMTIDQRNAGASVTPTNTGGSTYLLDRWKADISQASKFSVQQSSTAPTGFINSMAVTSLSAYAVGAAEVFAITQIVEGFNTADFAWGTASAATVTLSFWVRSSLTGTFGVVLENSANNRSYPATYTIIAANTWEQKSITIAGDTTGTWLTNNGKGVQIKFGLGVGATLSGTAGAWAAADYWGATGATSVVGTNGATWYITGVQLEKGTQATSFDFRSYGTELSLCQRYYENSFPYGTQPGVYVGLNSVHTTAFGDGNCPGTLFKVTKRDAPTVIYREQGATTTGFARNSGGTTTASATNISDEQVSFITLGSPVGGSFVRYTFEASAEL